MPLVRKPWHDFHLLKGKLVRQTFIPVILKEKLWMGSLHFISCFYHFVCILGSFVHGVCYLVRKEMEVHYTFAIFVVWNKLYRESQHMEFHLLCVSEGEEATCGASTSGIAALKAKSRSYQCLDERPWQASSKVPCPVSRICADFAMT